MNSSPEAFVAIPIGATFVLSGVPKICRRRLFVLTVMEYRILPAGPSRLYGLVVPPLELLVGLLLLAGVAVRLASATAAILLATFVVAVGINMARGRSLDCGCLGGLVKRRIGPALLTQDLILLGASLLLVVWARAWVGVEGWSFFHTATHDEVASAMPLLGCALLTMGISRLADIVASRRRMTRGARPT